MELVLAGIEISSQKNRQSRYDRNVDRSTEGAILGRIPSTRKAGAYQGNQTNNSAQWFAMNPLVRTTNACFRPYELLGSDLFTTLLGSL